MTEIEKEKLKKANIHRKYTPVKGSKKIGCPAKIEIREIAAFPEHKISNQSTNYKKKLQATSIKDPLEERNVKFERTFVLKLPNLDEHKGHATGESGRLFQQSEPNLLEEQLMHDESFYNVFAPDLKTNCNGNAQQTLSYIRSYLAEIEQMTYLLTHKTSLMQVKISLQELKETMKKHCQMTVA